MWRLKNSRGTFLDKYSFRHDQSFWWHCVDLLADSAPTEDVRTELLRWRDDPANRDAIHWAPTNSNCPAISALVDRLITLLPPEWQATGRNVFVGIAPLGEANAESWNHHRRGIIEFNLQYLWVLDDYAAAFDEFRHCMTLHLLDEERPALSRHPDSDYGRLVACWRHLQDAARDWRDPAVIHPGNDRLTRLAPGRRTSERQRLTAASETFIVAHELAHHLLAHTSRGARQRAQEAQEILAGVSARHSDDELAALPQAWRDELNADTIALAMIARRFDHRGNLHDGYAALLGGTVALLAATHIHGNWTPQGADGSHPPLSLRLRNIFHAATDWYRSAPRGKVGDHPMDLCNQLDLFADVAELCSEKPDLVDAMGTDLLEAIVAGEAGRRVLSLADVIPYAEMTERQILPEQRG